MQYSKYIMMKIQQIRIITHKIIKFLPSAMFLMQYKSLSQKAQTSPITNDPTAKIYPMEARSPWPELEREPEPVLEPESEPLLEPESESELESEPGDGTAVESAETTLTLTFMPDWQCPGVPHAK